jgi:hypothetical protein
MPSIESQESRAKKVGSKGKSTKPQALHPKILDNPLAARILADPDIAVFIKPFMRGNATVKAAAEEFGQLIQTMHYRVEQMVEAGLLEVVQLEQRRGRPIKHYRATAMTFQVATEQIPPRILQALGEQISWKTSFEQGLRQAAGDKGYGDKVVVYYLEPDDILIWSESLPSDPNVQFLAPELPAVLNQWSGAVYLDRTEAKAFQRELWELYERYAHRQGREKYVVHIGLVPYPK